MLRIDRPAIHVAADHMATRFLTLGQCIVVWSA